MADATYHFLSFVRSGFAASITQPDTFGSAQRAIASATVGVKVANVAQPVTHAAAVRGPGDVIGVSARQVVRTDPVDGAVGVEPNYFAQIEFDRPDLPWLFTPAAPVGEKLRPWIVLVVLDAEGPGACRVKPGSPLPRVSVSAEAAKALPELSASHLWAHAQVLTPGGETVAAALAGDPRLSVSRLLCPRHLQPNRWYVAAVVPAFNVGRLAGLGLPVTPQDEDKLEPAWQPGAAVELPVYHSWHLRTGEEADFESLARRLQGRPLPQGVGSRSLDVSRPGAGLPELPPPAGVDDSRSIAWLGGALRAIDDDALPPRDAAAARAFEASLTVLLDRPAALLQAGHADPVVAPPIYGDRHALVVKLGSGTPPPWISELNLDPAQRVAAGLGTQVIQARQEDYVARAWRQLGDVLAANRLLRAAQLARSGSLRLHQRLAQLDAPSMLSIAFPAHERLLGVVPEPVTLSRAVTRSRLPDIAVEPAFRRVARPASAAARAAGAGTLAPAVVQRFAAEVFVPASSDLDGVTRMRPAFEVIGATRASAVLRALGDARPDDAMRLDTMLGTLGAGAQALPSGEALRSLQLRSDAGAVSMVAGLGAVPAKVLSAVLTAAVAPPPAGPPGAVQPGVVQPGVVHPVQPGVVQPGALHPGVVQPQRIQPGLVQPARPPGGFAPIHRAVHLPLGLAGPAAAAQPAPPEAAPRRGNLVFRPAGATRPLGPLGRLEGGSVVLESALLQQIEVQGGLVAQLDDNRWSGLQLSAQVPAANAAADPSSDPGTRLDLFRRDPAAMAALAQLAGGQLSAAVTLDQSTAALSTSGAAAGTLAGLAGGSFNALLPSVGALVTGPDDVSAAREMVFATAGALDRMVLGSDAAAPPAAPVFDLAATRVALLRRLDPETTLPARVRTRLTIRVSAGVAPRDELDPVMACPQFDDPMWQAVRDLGSGWLLPGLEKVPPDTATLVRTNPAFVAAHMVGLNHEIMRELLWREYPTDQRGTPFHRFWGRRGAAPDDIGPVHGFAGRLTDNLKSGKDGEAVLLLRSELLRRYPGSLVYLCRAVEVNGELRLDDASIVAHSFRGDLPPDVSFVGFPIKPDELRATQNPWWFVIAQPPSEPRFGLDEPGAQTPARPASAADLAWSHMASQPDAFAPFAPADPAVLRGLALDGLGWGASAAVQAHLTYQRPVRVAIRARDLLPPQA